MTYYCYAKPVLSRWKTYFGKSD